MRCPAFAPRTAARRLLSAPAGTRSRLRAARRDSAGRDRPHNRKFPADGRKGASKAPARAKSSSPRPYFGTGKSSGACASRSLSVSRTSRPQTASYGVSSPAIIRRSVVLPQPEGPSSVVKRPFRIVSVVGCMTCFLSKLLAICSSRISMAALFSAFAIKDTGGM